MIERKREIKNREKKLKKGGRQIERNAIQQELNLFTIFKWDKKEKKNTYFLLSIYPT